MAGQLAEGARCFKGIGVIGKSPLTEENKTGTLVHSSSIGPIESGTDQVRHGCAANKGTSS
jgi:hypothetical protein